MRYHIDDVDGDTEAQILQRDGDSYTVKIGDRQLNLVLLSIYARGIEFELDGERHRARYVDASTSMVDVVIDGVRTAVRPHPDLDKIVYKNSGGGEAGLSPELKSQIPGKVVSVSVSKGDDVKRGDVVCVLESMKMQVSIKAHRDGKIKYVKVAQSDSVAKNDILAKIE